MDMRRRLCVLVYTPDYGRRYNLGEADITVFWEVAVLARVGDAGAGFGVILAAQSLGTCSRIQERGETGTKRASDKVVFAFVECC